MVIGLDFDNTIVDYNALFYCTALESELVDGSVAATKTAVRDFVRRHDGGEILWQKLQATIYGPDINKAVLFSGVLEFLSRCVQCNMPVYVVSHKTQYARRGEVDLRKAALGFMESKGLFNEGPFGLNKERVFFADTRQEKVDIICSLGCDFFIDDLIEVFEEPSFPVGIAGFLFDPGNENQNAGVSIVNSWSLFSEKVFNTALCGDLKRG